MLITECTLHNYIELKLSTQLIKWACREALLLSLAGISDQMLPVVSFPHNIHHAEFRKITDIILYT